MKFRAMRLKDMLAGLSRVFRLVPGRIVARRGSDSALEEHPADRSVLPILTRQLLDASEDMASEVSKVCTNFDGMALGAVESVKTASRILDAEGDCEIAGVIQRCRETTLTLLDRLERGGELSRRAIRGMERVESTVAQVSRTLADLDNSAFCNRLVALNAKIEAAHLGDAGRGFDVVASEVSAQADRTTDLTCQVKEALTELVVGARGAVSEWRKFSEADDEWVRTSREEVHGLLSAMQKASSEMRSSLEETSIRSQQLAADIEQALITLQFQDRVSQRIQHVAHALEAMHMDDGKSDLTDLLAGSYTMNCERQVHSDAKSDRPAASAEAEIELF